MKVLHALGELRASGAEVMLRTAGPLWADLGVDSEILAVGPSIGPFAEELQAAGYGVHHIQPDRRIDLLHNFSSLLHRNRYDVVHLHSEWAFMHLALIARTHRSSVVRTVHTNFQFEGNLRLQRILQRNVARRAGVRFIAISQRVAENERTRFRNPTSRVDNWFDSSRFVLTTAHERTQARSRLGVPPDAYVAVTVGNCSPTKNHVSLLRGLAALEEPMLLLHVGEEDEGQPERKLVKELRLEGRCLFLGRTDPLPALQAADLFVMPSLYEGFSIASLEALATGLPAVLTEVPGNLDLQNLGVRAVWSSTDPKGLESSLAVARSQWIESPTPEDALQQSRRIAKQFSAAQGVARYAGIYRDLVA